jgi:osmotically-inducible protein OsmY
MEDVNLEAPSDATIKRLIVDELYWDSRLDVSKIKVEVDHGNVVLTGRVPTIADRLTAEADARMIRDVESVTNLLQVDPTQPIPNGELRANIISVLNWAPDVDNSRIEVAASEGTVTLRGTVPRYWDKMRAHLLTSMLQGVARIVDEVAVTPTQKRADQEIAGDLERALERRIPQEVSQVQVSVADGRVSLRGLVADDAVRQRVQETAELTLGVVAVHNELCVQQARHAL